VLLITVGIALAGATRCVARWEGPVDGCPLVEVLRVEGAAPGPRAAERAARGALESAVKLYVTAYKQRYPQIDPKRFAQCGAVVRASAFVDCFPDPGLGKLEALCFAELADPECWDGRVLTVEGTGWTLVQEGRSEMCRAVDQQVVQQDFLDRDVMRSWCAASCAADTRVRCP
jgi:hypothetical protein